MSLDTAVLLSADSCFVTEALEPTGSMMVSGENFDFRSRQDSTRSLRIRDPQALFHPSYRQHILCLTAGR